MNDIKIHGYVIRPAIVNGHPDVFTSPQFTLIKAAWEPDDSRSHCDLCSSKFTQLKRRHHCRMCGLVRCGKCCSEKIPLPQLALEEAERVCDMCQAVAKLVLKSRSHSNSVLKEAAQGLALFANNSEHVKKLLELGGLQALVALSLTDNPAVLRQVIAGLHALATHPSIHNWLADSGGIKAICKIISTIGAQDTQSAEDGIGALMIFCKLDDFKVKDHSVLASSMSSSAEQRAGKHWIRQKSQAVLGDGGLSPVLNLCWSTNDAISLLAIRTLGLIAEHAGTHTAIFEDKRNSIALMFTLSESEDEQIQEVALKTLAFLSTGTQQHRLRIIQEDFNNGRPLLKVLGSTPNNPQILCNAACLVANLAVHKEHQIRLQDYLDCVCRRLSTADSNTELLCHLTRALANFVKHKQSCPAFVTAVPTVVQYCLKSSIEPIKAQSMRLLLSLLNYDPSGVALSLVGDGGHTFLTSLGKIQGLVEAIHTTMSNEAPDTVKPL